MKKVDKSSSAGTKAEQRTEADNSTSASLLPNPVLGEEREENRTISDEQIDAYVLEMMKSNPVKFVQYCLVVIGRDMFQANASNFKFNQECDLEKDRRFSISVKGTIKELTKK